MIKFLLNPFNLFLLLFFASVGIFIFKRENVRHLKLMVVTMSVWLLAISTPTLPGLILRSLERHYTPVMTKELSDETTAYHIIVLGGGHGFDDHLPPNSLLSRNALGRLAEGIRLHRQLPNSKLVFSGFSASGRTTQAEMLMQTAQLLGVDVNSTILQNEPENTYEEAKIYSERFGRSHPLILVTSAAHMPRAVKVFRHFGLDPIPSPTNYRLKGSWGSRWIGLPALDNMVIMREGIYEYAALIWYSLTL